MNNVDAINLLRKEAFLVIADINDNDLKNIAMIAVGFSLAFLTTLDGINSELKQMNFKEEPDEWK